MKRVLNTVVLVPWLTVLLAACGGGPPDVGEGGVDSGETAAPGEVAMETESVTAEDVEITPDIVVENQAADGTFVMVESIATPVDGWIVIYSDANGAPGDALAQEPVFLGINPRVSVDLGQEPAVGTKLIAVLHEDTGAAGEFEFPGADEPIDQGGKVMAGFEIEATRE